MKVEDAGISEEKKELLQELSEEYDVEVKILSGWTGKLTYPVHRGGACLNLPFKSPFIVLYLDFVQDLPVRSVEHLMLHEIGHAVLYRATSSKRTHEEFAEKFALKHFSGFRQEYYEAWASKMYWNKSREPLDNVEIGDDFL